MSKTDYNKNLFKNATTCSDYKGSFTGQQLPGWIQGIILYNGPTGIFDFKNMTVNHWFDGMSVMCSFKIQEKGKHITLTKKFLKSNSYNEGMEHGRIIRAEFGTPGSKEVFHYPLKNKDDKDTETSLLMHRFARAEYYTPNDTSDNGHCSFYQFGNLTMATTENAFDRIIDPNTLETGDLIDMSNLVNLKTGRPLRDHNGDYYNLTASFIAGIKYHFIKFPKPFEGTHYAHDNFPNDVQFVATIPSRFPKHIGYFHSFTMTDNFLIFCEQPYASNVEKFMNNKNQRKSFKECLEWMPNEKNRFHVVDKHSGNIIEIKYMSETPFYFLNFVNSYESGCHIIVDVLAYDNPEILNKMYLNKLRSESDLSNTEYSSKILRFVLPLDFQHQEIDLNAGRWKEATAIRQHDTIYLRSYPLTERTGMEHPKINPNFAFRRYNYTYVVSWMHGLNPECYFANAITKIDVETGNTYSWKTGDENSHPNEIVFIPNPAAASEDDGVLISSISNAKEENKSYLVFINAKNMMEMARATFNHPIPFGQHSFYVEK